MSDTLKIYGNTYTEITSIKAADPSGNELVYIRPQGVKNITENGSNIDVAEYATVNVSVSGGGGSPTLQTKTKSYTPTESQQTEAVTADSGYDGLDTVNITVGAISSSYVGTGITRRSSSDLTASGATISVPSGYYESAASKSVTSGTEGTPTATKGTVSNHSVSVTPSVTNTTGYITGSTKTGTAVTVSASELVSGTRYIYANGTNIDVTDYAAVNVDIEQNINIPYFSIELDENRDPIDESCDKTCFECYELLNDSMLPGAYVQVYGESEEITVARYMGTDGQTQALMFTGFDASGLPVYDIFYNIDDTIQYIEPSGMGVVLVEATINTNGIHQPAQTPTQTVAYSSVNVQVPTGTARSSSDLTISGATVNVPAGLYSSAASKSVASGTAGTPTATKGTVSNHSVSVTPSVTNTTGYITGSTKTGTAVTVSASELVSGSATQSSNGTYDVTNLASLVVAVPIVTYYTGSSVPSASLGSNGDIYLQTES